MQAFHYILRILLHAKGSNLLKVVSLGLGLTMSILLFARVAFEQSYDTVSRTPTASTRCGASSR